MITLENLKAFSDTLHIIQTELDELIKVRSEDKLFNSSDDYYTALKACQYYPQDYYRMRLFDVNICLRFNNRLKQFYIKIDSVKDIPEITNFKDFFQTNKVKATYNYKNIYIENQYTFEDVVKIFYKFCIEFLKYKYSDNKLFYI